MAVPTIDSIPTPPGRGRPGPDHGRRPPRNGIAASAVKTSAASPVTLELSATLQIDRIWWASGSDRLFRLQRNPPGITQPGPEDDMSECGVAGSGAGKAVFLLFDGIGVPIQIDVSTVFSSGGAFVNLVAAPAAASLLDGIAVGDLVNFVVADAGQPPVAVGEIETVTLEHDGSTNLDIARYFARPRRAGPGLLGGLRGSRHRDRAALVGPTLTLTAVSEGSATGHGHRHRSWRPFARQKHRGFRIGRTHRHLCLGQDGKAASPSGEGAALACGRPQAAGP